jgi:hypothetical protein
MILHITWESWNTVRGRDHDEYPADADDMSSTPRPSQLDINDRPHP